MAMVTNEERKRRKVAEDIHPSLRELKEEGEGYECPVRHFPKALLKRGKVKRLSTTTKENQ